MMRVRVSAVVPTHDRPKMLKVALESIAAQSSPPDELIVVDDMGDPETKQVVDQFAEAAPFPTRYVHNQVQGGACGSRNLGASLATHPWLIFLDDDDVWRPRHVELLTARADSGDVDFVMGGLVRREKGHPDRIRYSSEGLTAETLFSEQGGMTGSNLLVSRAAFEGVSGFDVQIPVFNDWDLFARLLAANRKYAVVQEPTVEWREHGGIRITGASVKRAQGFDIFLQRYGNAMPGALRRRLKRTALGIRRRHAEGIGDRAILLVRLAMAYTPMELGRRLVGRSS